MVYVKHEMRGKNEVVFRQKPREREEGRILKKTKEGGGAVISANKGRWSATGTSFGWTKIGKVCVGGGGVE